MFLPKSTSPYSPQDDELLSAYLDGRLTPAEVARLEARLATDPELRRRLQELRRVVQLLAQAPRLAVPRAFVLNEAQVAASASLQAGERGLRRSGWLRGLTLATAVVALALVFTLGVDVWSQRQTGVTVLMAPAAQPEAAVAVPTAPPEALAVAPPAEDMAAATMEAPTEVTFTLKAMTTPESSLPTEGAEPMDQRQVQAAPTVEGTPLALSQTETAAPTIGYGWLRVLEIILTAALVVLVLAMVLMRRRRSIQ